MAKDWAELSPDEKREQRFRRWLSPPGVTFASPQAEKLYKERVTRFIKAFTLQKPDRVPVVLPSMGFYAAKYAGTNLGTVMYDYAEMKRAWLAFLKDFDGDTYVPPALVPPGRALDAMDYKLYKWPGHGLGKDVLSYQAVEGEWMKPDEYDTLINDPSDFWLRIFMPRIFGALKGFTQLPPWITFEEIAFNFLPFGLPDVQAGFNALMKAGNETMQWLAVVGEVAGQALAMGYPGIMAGLAKAPFDTLGDTLRGTQGIMLDMFQRPQKVHEAMERIVPLQIYRALSAVNAGNTPVVIMPLHKGADTFMSVKQYETFYWPTFKKVVMGLVNEGIFVVLFAEGSYNKRLDIIGDFPKGTVAWYFDQTDIFEAKKKIGDRCCIMGNVPTSLMMTGTPKQIKEHCRKLIEVCGKGGGYILAGGANLDEGNPENMRAMMAAAVEYGKY